MEIQDNSVKDRLSNFDSLREVILSENGWDNQHVNQDANWDVSDHELKIWKPFENNGTELWTENLLNADQLPLKLEKKVYTPTSNFGGTWGDNDDSNEVKIWKRFKNNGTELWAENLLSADQLPLKLEKKVYSPTSNFGSTWGENNDSNNASNAWTSKSNNSGVIGGVSSASRSNQAQPQNFWQAGAASLNSEWRDTHDMHPTTLDIRKDEAKYLQNKMSNVMINHQTQNRYMFNHQTGVSGRLNVSSEKWLKHEHSTLSDPGIGFGSLMGASGAGNQIKSENMWGHMPSGIRNNRARNCDHSTLSDPGTGFGSLMGASEAQLKSENMWRHMPSGIRNNGARNCDQYGNINIDNADGLGCYDNNISNFKNGIRLEERNFSSCSSTTMPFVEVQNYQQRLQNIASAAQELNINHGPDDINGSNSFLPLQELPMLVEEIKMALDYGYLNVDLLNQCLAPKTFIFIKTLVNNIKLLHLAQNAIPTNCYTIMHIKKIILHCQNKIRAQQINYIRQKQLDLIVNTASHSGNGNLGDDGFECTALQSYLSEMNLSDQPRSFQEAPIRQSKLNQCELPDFLRNDGIWASTQSVDEWANSNNNRKSLNSFGRQTNITSISGIIPQQSAKQSYLCSEPRASLRPPPGFSAKKPAVVESFDNIDINADFIGNQKTIVTGINDAGPNNSSSNFNSAWLLLHKVSTRIDGSTLFNLCLNFGSIIDFHLCLTEGIVLCKYATATQASEAQMALNNFVVENTTIFAESLNDCEAQTFLQHLPPINVNSSNDLIEHSAGNENTRR